MEAKREGNGGFAVAAAAGIELSIHFVFELLPLGVCFSTEVMGGWRQLRDHWKENDDELLLPKFWSVRRPFGAVGASLRRRRPAGSFFFLLFLPFSLVQSLIMMMKKQSKEVESWKRTAAVFVLPQAWMPS
jgi:hypothetical protein